MKIFGTIGRIGAGKDTIVKYLNIIYGVPYLSVGDKVREMLKAEGLALTRANLQSVAEQRLKEHGERYFMNMIIKEIRENDWETAAVTGIRTPADIHALKDEFGHDFILFHVYVNDPLIRYKRLRQRGEPRDPKSYEEFQEQDKEEKKFGIEEAVAMADYSLPNDGTPEDLHREISKVLDDAGLLQ